MKVEIIMGSKSDLSTMEKVATKLNQLGISNHMSIYSAHRTPNELANFIHTEIDGPDSDCEVVIAGAGMSAALAGAIAAETLKPVIGIPLSGGKFHGVEALLSTLEMPPGNPVLTVGVDATNNAALAAARILALTDADVSENLAFFKSEQKDAVLEANAELQKSTTP